MATFNVKVPLLALAPIVPLPVIPVGGLERPKVSAAEWPPVRVTVKVALPLAPA